MDEVLGMLSFANDIVSHLSQVEVILKKEKKKRLRREQLQTDAEKLEVSRWAKITLTSLAPHPLVFSCNGGAVEST